MTIRSESTNRNILIQAPGLDRHRRVQRKSFVDTVHGRRKSFDCLLTDFRHRKRGIHYILMPQQSNAWFFFDESTRKCTDSIFRLISICIDIHCIQYSISSTAYYPPEIVSMRAAVSTLYIPFFITIILFPKCKMSGKKMISIKSQCVRVSTAKMKILITYSLISDSLLRDYHKPLVLSNVF